jgi:hypothetical protein
MSPLRVTPKIVSPPKNAGESPCFVKMARQHFRNLALQIGDEAGTGSWLAQQSDSLPVRGPASAEASSSARYSSVLFHLSAPSQGGNSRNSTNTRGIPPHPWVPTSRHLTKGSLSFLYMSRGGWVGWAAVGLHSVFGRFPLALACVRNRPCGVLAGRSPPPAQRRRQRGGRG